MSPREDLLNILINWTRTRTHHEPYTEPERYKILQLEDKQEKKMKFDERSDRK